IVFAQSRLATEVLLTAIKSGVADKTGDSGIVRGYRGGYLPTRRGAVEKGLREGEVLGVVSTNALELGVDIGHLDVAVLAGYPGGIASLWQEPGRAGRRSGRGRPGPPAADRLRSSSRPAPRWTSSWSPIPSISSARRPSTRACTRTTRSSWRHTSSAPRSSCRPSTT